MHSDNVMFILFPGYGISEYDWDEIGFVKELKRIGKVFVYTPNFYNIFRYYHLLVKDKYNRLKYFPNSDLSFTVKDLGLKTHCEQIYEEIKGFKGKFVPIGHSIGVLWATEFSRLYSDRCKMCILIDGTMLSPISKTFYKEDFVKGAKRFKGWTDIELEKLKKNVVELKRNSVYKIIDFVIYSLLSQLPKRVEIPIKTISFRNLDIKSKKIDEITVCSIKDAKNFEKNLNYTTVFLINRTHFPFTDVRGLKEIMSVIRCEI